MHSGFLAWELSHKHSNTHSFNMGLGLHFEPPLFVVVVVVGGRSAFLIFFVVLLLRVYFNRIPDCLLQYVVVPTRRSTAEAFQILISHMFGDAGSPYLVGLVSKLDLNNIFDRKFSY